MERAWRRHGNTYVEEATKVDLDGTDDPFDLVRFVAAQEETYESALAEIRRGWKRTHWMWFIFPQLRGLGHSAMAHVYGMRSLDEARAYLDHPLLGSRYRECVGALQDLIDTNAEKVFGDTDAMKLRSSLTLFGEAADLPLIRAALERWFRGKPDEATLHMLARQGRS